MVHAVLNNREKYLGKKIAMAGESISPNEAAEILSKRILPLQKEGRSGGEERGDEGGESRAKSPFIIIIFFER